MFVVNLPPQLKHQPQQEQQQTNQVDPERWRLQEQQLDTHMETEIEVDEYLPSEDHESAEVTLETDLEMEQPQEPKTKEPVLPPHDLESNTSTPLPFRPKCLNPEDEPLNLAHEQHGHDPQRQYQGQGQEPKPQTPLATLKENPGRHVELMVNRHELNPSNHNSPSLGHGPNLGLDSHLNSMDMDAPADLNGDMDARMTALATMTNKTLLIGLTLEQEEEEL